MPFYFVTWQFISSYSLLWEIQHFSVVIWRAQISLMQQIFQHLAMGAFHLLLCCFQSACQVI